ncbi:molybdopterin-dependent oxidoreductase [Nocardioides sp. BP30]|uniref:molybdopterin-dependent oxidoreductase n=1 Tax=Nocardioides sp. BP30 TaxID=3036374 RepID=UPI00246941CF|nr:molybdopterin-dependent oxidoreductase [Nocardioides sp. BP30]WGL51173.1 molybdopterin-dependent oxidoreductase [Nocardioides sp. BP30]
MSNEPAGHQYPPPLLPAPPRPAGRRRGAFATALWLLVGPVTGGLGLAAGHLVAALTTPAASPVLAVGSTVIDRTPTSLKEWAIAHFGTHDKTILVGSVLVVVLLLSTAVGPLARRRAVYGAAALVLLAGIAAACALRRPEASAGAAVPSLVAGVVAVLALMLVLRLQARHVRPSSTGEAVGGGQTRGPRSSRRTLVVLGALAALAAALGETGRLVIARRARAEDVTLPAPAEPAPAFPAGIDRTVPGITAFRTPASRFYRVDTRLDVPVVDSDGWSLRIDGDVARPFEIDYRELLAMPMIERDITLTCVSNSVGGPYVGGARWLGVRLSDLLERAGVGHSADQILSTDFAGMTISTPLALATDGRDAMVAVGMNGAPLPRAHGFPARLVIPGLYGFISATKWVTRLTLTTYAQHSAYWTDRGWATDAPIKISSRIDTPRPLASVKRGDQVLGGVAWAQQNGGVAKVEVSIDGGPWTAAHLGPSAGNDYWRQWYAPWRATPGTHTLACRVVDGAGQTQTPVRAEPFPSGASGVQTITVSVA